MDRSFSRRKLLRSAALLTTASTAVGLAGCASPGSETSTADGTQTRTSTQGAPTAETEARTGQSETAGRVRGTGVRAWLPQPEWFGRDHYVFFANDYTVIRANEAQFADSVYTDFSRNATFDLLGLTVDDVTHTVRLDPFSEDRAPNVVHGAVDPSPVSERLTDDGYAEAKSSGRYSYYVGPDERRGVAVTDGVAVAVTSDYPVGRLDLILGTTDPGYDGYGTADPDLAAVLDSAGDGTFRFGETFPQIEAADADPENGIFTGQVAEAYTDTVSGATTATTVVLAFRDDNAVDMDAVAAYTGGPNFDHYERVEATQEGLLVVITGTVDTGKLYT